MDPNGQVYFDHEDKIPEADVARLKREMEAVDSAFKARVQELMMQNQDALERLADGPD